MPAPDAAPPLVRELTVLTGETPVLKAHIGVALVRLTGAVPLAFDFHRHWNGGWRVHVVLEGTPERTLEFALLAVGTAGGILPLPRPFPEAWRRRTGFPATDGTLWTEQDDGMVVPFGSPATPPVPRRPPPPRSRPAT